MYIYNVSVSVDDEIQSDWLSWMSEEHIPEVMDTGYFTGFKIFKILLKEFVPSQCT